MKECWSLQPGGRPNFSEIKDNISVFLEKLAGYLDIGAFGVITTTTEADICTSKEAEDTVK